MMENEPIKEEENTTVPFCPISSIEKWLNHDDFVFRKKRILRISIQMVCCFTYFE